MKINNLLKAHMVTALIILNAINGFSQDLIVTGDNDSINCVITKIKPDYIYFTYKNGADFPSTLIPVSEVKDYKEKYYQTAEVPAYQVFGYIDYPRFRFGISGGYSYQRGKIDKNAQDFIIDYTKKLRSGFNVGADFTYYYRRSLGFGAKYNYFGVSNQLNNIYVDYDDGSRRYGTLSDNIMVHYFGPSYSVRVIDHNNKNSLYFDFSMGHMSFRNNYAVVDAYEMTGSSIGMTSEIAYDYKINDNMAIGLKFSMIYGSLYKYDVSDGVNTETYKLEDEDYLTLNRFDLSVGLRFAK